MTGQRWWHAYGCARDGYYMLTVLGDTTIEPSRAPASLRLWDPVEAEHVEAVWLQTWDRQPSEAEKDALYPEGYGDE